MKRLFLSLIGIAFAVAMSAQGFTNPVVKTSKIRTLTYGINATRYIIHTPQEEVINKSTSGRAFSNSSCGVNAIIVLNGSIEQLITLFLFRKH